MATPSAPSAKTGPRRPDLDSLYCLNEDGSRNTIHPADVKGRYQIRKKIIWTILIAIYVAIPWIDINGNPAVLFDIPGRNFFLFGATFNAQDFYLAYFVLTGIGFSLFIVSALFGRIWCGYSCPHTVFLDGVYRRIERFFDGNATQRKKLQAMPWNAQKIARRGAKWLSFLVVSAVLSHTFLSYFMPVEEVLAAVTHSPAAHPVAFTFIVIFTAIIYFNFTWFREQLCIVICPYGRLQGVLYDRDTINVTYDTNRGEPRGRYTKSREADERGDCIDCQRCIAVCPTGIDIRNGTQLECIGCANCIDACDEVMEKVGQPVGLIRYDSQRAVEEGARRFLRPRVFFYAFLLLLGATVLSVAAYRRTPFESNLVRQQGSPYVVVEGSGAVRNPFFVHLVNKQPREHTFLLEPVEQAGVTFTVPIREVKLASTTDQSVPIFVEVTADAWQPGMRFQLRVRTADGTLERTEEAVLLGPAR